MRNILQKKKNSMRNIDIGVFWMKSIVKMYIMYLFSPEFDQDR